MSKIVFEKETLPLSVYKNTLQDCINYVLRKIQETDKGITWVICSEEYLYKRSNKSAILKTPIKLEMVRSNKYGIAVPKKRTIYISTAAIQSKFAINSTLKKLFKLLGQPQIDLLERVIIDEFTHIVTCKNHGDEEYERTYAKYINMLMKVDYF